MTYKKENVSPFAAALKAATIAGGLISALGLTAGGIACVGVALVGTAVWFVAKCKKINPVLMEHNLTPEGDAFACGLNAQQKILKQNKIRY